MDDNVSAVATIAQATAPADRVGAGLGYLEKAVLEVLDRTLRSHSTARVRLVTPSGAVAIVGDQAKPVVAELAVRSYRSLWSVARRGALGFAEAYMNGWVDTPDLRAVFNFFLDNEAAIVAAFPGMNDTKSADRRYHRRRRNTLDGSRRNIADHYDLGNEFYSLWLDASMLYSSGIYRDAHASLEDAQREKLSVIIAALQLQEGKSLLEIGCGWGAMAEAAAKAGANVRAITISEQQRRAAQQRIAVHGLSKQAEVVFEDYRNATGTFDRLVSIEMIEAVGEENWPAYFDVVSKRLSPGGIAVIQAITIREDAFERYRANPDFIQRYIFPGGMLPTVDIMRAHAEQAGMSFETIERFGPSYSATLADWRFRFSNAWPEIAALGFDERFRRMWLYYMHYCEVGFDRNWIDVGIYRMRKSNEPSADQSTRRGG